MNALLRYPGAKWSTAEKIISYFPEHKSYLEPYFGSGAILFNKVQSRLETINDINGEIINFFKVLKNHNLDLKRELQNIPYSRDIYYYYQNLQTGNEIERAVKFFVLSWMSHGGCQTHKTGWSHSKNPDGPNKAIIFKKIIESLEDYSKRLKEVYIENYPAIELIKQHDFDGTFIYLDPPYTLDTRKQYLYKDELNNDEHIELLETIKNLKHAKVMISGYNNDLYNNYLANWTKETFDNVDTKGQKKIEVIWMNYNNQLTLF